MRQAEPTGDAELDLALESLLQASRSPKTKVWVSRPRRGIVAAYRCSRRRGQGSPSGRRRQPGRRSSSGSRHFGTGQLIARPSTATGQLQGPTATLRLCGTSLLQDPVAGLDVGWQSGPMSTTAIMALTELAEEAYARSDPTSFRDWRPSL